MYFSAIHKSNCFHRRGHEASCSVSYSPYIISMGVVELIVSQIPNFHKLSMLSIVAAVMSFAYSSIGLGLSIAKLVSGDLYTLDYSWSDGFLQASLFFMWFSSVGAGGTTTLTGVEVGTGLSAADKTWRMFSAFGDIAFAYTYSQVLVEIQVKWMSRVSCIRFVWTLFFKISTPSVSD